MDYLVIVYFFNFKNMTQGLEGGRYYAYEGGVVELDDLYAPVEPYVPETATTDTDRGSFNVREEVTADLLGALNQ